MKTAQPLNIASPASFDDAESVLFYFVRWIRGIVIILNDAL
jgi:hypothetical protein